MTHLDPRTVLLSVLVINTITYQSAHLAILIGCMALAAVMLACKSARYAVVAALIFAALQAGYFLLLQLPSHLLFAFAAATSAWFSRFCVSISVGAAAIFLITPSALTAALRAMRMPSMITIPTAVFIRILPVILDEYRAIHDAMLLRGIRPGVRHWIAHPTQSSVMLVIPLLSAVVRAGDELASSALVRGLGGPAAPTTRMQLRFTIADAAMICALIVLSAAAFKFQGGAL